MIITHVIYHIPGRKVGCTKNLERRKQRYLKYEGSIPEIEVLEELYDKSDREAGDIEISWRNRFGYRGESHYADTLTSARAGALGLNNSMTKEQKHAIGLLAGRRAVELGRTGFQNLTHEQRSNAGKIGGRATANLPGHLANIARNGGGRKGGLRTSELKKSGMHLQGSCVHCGTTMSLASLGRHHNDRCPRRPLTRRT